MHFNLRLWKALAFLICLHLPVAAYSENPVKIGDVDHIGLAVKNLEVTLQFFTDDLGFELAGRDEGYPSAFVVNDHVMVTLWQVKTPSESVPFDRRKNIGLHHLALRVDSEADLNQLYEQLKKVEGVRIEFAPEPLGNSAIKHMMLYEPGGIRLEFIHKPKKKTQ